MSRLCLSYWIYSNKVEIITTPTQWPVDNVVFQDQQANAELTKIMGEFAEPGDQSPTASSKGDDLLAMMDGLWHGHPDWNTQGVETKLITTEGHSAVCTCKCMQQPHMEPDDFLLGLLLRCWCERVLPVVVRWAAAYLHFTKKNKECVVSRALSCDEV